MYDSERRSFVFIFSLSSSAAAAVDCTVVGVVSAVVAVEGEESNKCDGDDHLLMCDARVDVDVVGDVVV